MSGGRARIGGEEGTVAVFVAGLALALFMVAGLVYDGGQILAERREAFAVAGSAARAGAQAVDLAALRADDVVQVDPGAAASAARAFLDRAGLDGEVTVTADAVEVVAQSEARLTFLRIVGMETRTVTGRAEAVLVRGVTAPGG